MKITQIKLTDFHQFKDLTIDLTYPKGHAKEGQPLDKVCFIGQSGTGKTSLLELIPKFLLNYDTQFIYKSGLSSICDNIEISFVFGIENEYSVTSKFKNNELDLTAFDISGEDLENDNLYYDWSWSVQNDISLKNTISFFSQKWLKEISTRLIYFPANLNYDIEVGVENALTKKEIIDFSKEKVSKVWHIVTEKIKLYQEKEIQIRLEISKTVEQATNNLDILEKSFQNLRDWKKKEFNPVQDIADNCLNRLLAPFKLKVKTELEFKSTEDIGFIKVEDYNGNEIPHGLWSTGTKQVILSAMPMYLLKPKRTVILLDEPERSLYPDMQRFIVDYYSSLTENCQFFYATHSPIIASSFEPWEIVELKFNEEGKIYRELYYEGENHIDNYKWNPKHMRWDDILQRVFDMADDGAPERKTLLDELGKSNIKYRKLKAKEQHESGEAKELLKRIEYLRTALSKWD